MVVGVIASYVQTEPRVNTTVRLAVMAARDSSGGAFAATKHTTAGKFHHTKMFALAQKTRNIQYETMLNSD